MRKYRVTIPESDWPAELVTRFHAIERSPAQQKRHRDALGRWVMWADDPLTFTHASLQKVLASLSPARRKEVEGPIRLVLAQVFPEHAATLQAPRAGNSQQPNDERSELAQLLQGALPHLPPNWRAKAEDTLRIDPDHLHDGILIEVWSPATIKRRVQAAVAYFAICREHGLTLELHARGLRASLAKLQTDKGRPTSAAIFVDGLLMLAKCYFPERDWTWLQQTKNKMKKFAAASPARNAARALPVDDLRRFGLAVFREAEEAFERAVKQPERKKAHTLARTALTIVLLSEAPMRIGSLAKQQLSQDLLKSMMSLRVDADATKTKSAEIRVFSSDAIRCLRVYVDHMRPFIAAPETQTLLVHCRGGSPSRATLTAEMGKLTAKRLGTRVTPHAVRHAAANFIVASAPDMAALASVILNHRSRSMTNTYTVGANQVKASQTLATASRQTSRQLGMHERKAKRTQLPRRATSRKKAS